MPEIKLRDSTPVALKVSDSNLEIIYIHNNNTLHCMLMASLTCSAGNQSRPWFDL
jgi:hypothetical protein